MTSCLFICFRNSIKFSTVLSSLVPQSSKRVSFGFFFCSISAISLSSYFNSLENARKSIYNVFFVEQLAHLAPYMFLKVLHHVFPLQKYKHLWCPDVLRFSDFIFVAEELEAQQKFKKLGALLKCGRVAKLAGTRNQPSRLGLAYVPLCQWHRVPFGDWKWPPGRAHTWIAKKPLFNSGFVKLVKRKMAFFQTFKWLIWNKLFGYWTLNVKHFTPPRNIYCIYIILAEYGIAETCFYYLLFNLLWTEILKNFGSKSFAQTPRFDKCIFVFLVCLCRCEIDH